MDPGITALFSWQFILFGLGVSVIMWFIRTITEYAFPKLDNYKFWTELCLPLLPPSIGALIAYFATKYAYPDGLTSLSGRLLFGSVAGLLSGLIFQVAKGMLKDKIQNFVSSQQSSNQSNPASQVIPFPTNR
jgi:hypothetical protein